MVRLSGEVCSLKRDTLRTSGIAMRLLDFCMANDLELFIGPSGAC